MLIYIQNSDLSRALLPRIPQILSFVLHIPRILHAYHPLLILVTVTSIPQLYTVSIYGIYLKEVRTKYRNVVYVR